MKINVQTSTLRDGIARVADTTKSGGTLPILSNLLLEASAGILTLSATNLDQSSRVNLVADVQEAGKTTLPCTRLFNIVRAVSDESLEISVENDVALIHAGGDERKVTGLSAEEFPAALFPGDGAKEWKMNPADLRNIFLQLGPVASTDNGRYVLNGLHMLARGPLLEWCAADGRMLSFFTTDNEGPEVDAILPNDFIRQAIKALDEEAEVTLAVSSTAVRLVGKDYTLASKLIEGSYPNIKQALPTACAGSIDLDREGFLKKLSSLAAGTANQNKEVFLYFDGTHNNLDITASKGQPYEAKGFLPVKLAVPFHCTLNHRFIESSLRNLPHDEITMEYADDRTPVVFKAGNSLIAISVIRTAY